jgi:beta-N-acetylhexosaminidase
MVLTSKRDPALTHSQLLNKINVTIPQKRIEEAAEKIFKLKQDLGLFEDGGATSQIPSSLEAFNYFANKLTREAVTVVKAQSGVLPYTKYPPASLANTQNNKEEKPKLCSVFFSPSRFADQLQIIQAPFLEKGWEVEFYNAYMRPRDTDITRAKRCMQKADLVIIGSMQWADKPIASQKRAIAELLKSNKDIVFVSLMSPYDIKFYPEAKNVIALYGINHMSSQAAADVILGNIEPKGKLPIKL